MLAIGKFGHIELEVIAVILIRAFHNMGQTIIYNVEASQARQFLIGDSAHEKRIVKRRGSSARGHHLHLQLVKATANLIHINIPMCNALWGSYTFLGVQRTVYIT